MKNISLFLILIFAFFSGCATNEENEKEKDRNHHEWPGELIREGYPKEINPFVILERLRMMKEGGENGFLMGMISVPTILEEDVDDDYPLSLVGLPSPSGSYILSIKVSAEYYTEKEYLISLRTLTEDGKECGLAKNVTFYRTDEKHENGIVEYSSRMYRNGEGVYEGTDIFFAKKEMSSHKSYNVLKVCPTEENREFRLEGVVL